MSLEPRGLQFCETTCSVTKQLAGVLPHWPPHRLPQTHPGPTVSPQEVVRSTPCPLPAHLPSCKCLQTALRSSHFLFLWLNIFVSLGPGVKAAIISLNNVTGTKMELDGFCHLMPWKLLSWLKKKERERERFPERGVNSGIWLQVQMHI